MENMTSGTATQAPATAKRKRSSIRPQFGSIRAKHGAWYWEYYGADKKKKMERIASAAEVRSRREICDAINKRIAQLGPAIYSPSGDAPRTGNVTIATFAEDDYLPWAKGALRPATYNGYWKMWQQHLKPHFGDRKLRDYFPYHATEFLSELAKNGLGKNTVAHIRALMSAVFSHAVAKGHLTMNPIHGAKLLHKPKAQAQTESYSLEEMGAILASLNNDADAQDHAVMALAFLGLRRAEISGAKWSDIDWLNGVLRVRRSAWAGKVSDGAKNDRSIRDVTLGEIALCSLGRWDKRSQHTGEYVFSNAEGNPLDLGTYSVRAIRPKFKARNLIWRGFHAGRRGAVTEMRRYADGETTSFHFGHSRAVADARYDKGRADETRRAALAYDASLASSADNSGHRVQ